MIEDLGQDTTDGIHPQQISVLPIALALMLTIAVIGLMLSSSFLVLLAAIVSFVLMVAWGVQRLPGQPEPPLAPAERIALPALGEGEAEAEAPIAIGRSPGWWGMVWFIATEASFFAFLIAAYIYMRARSEVWPPPGMPQRDLLLPSINTAILLLSGVPAFYAERAIKRGDSRGLRIGLILAALLGALFLCGQGYEYLTAGFNLQTSVFASGFFVLTGFHGAHVIAGITLLLVMFVFSLRGRFSAQQNFGVQFASTYWHFVDIVWVFLFVTLYLFQ